MWTAMCLSDGSSAAGGLAQFRFTPPTSMRCKGENVSAYEVEQAILKHPDVLECAVYAVPSELAEDDIMVTLVPIEGRSLDPAELPAFLSDKLAKFAIPRYYRIIDVLPKTETHRVIKKDLEALGVMEDTYDSA